MATIKHIESFLEVIEERIKESSVMEYVVCAMYHYTSSNYSPEFKDHVRDVLTTTLEESEMKPKEYEEFMEVWKWIYENVDDVYVSLKLKAIRACKVI